MLYNISAFFQNTSVMHLDWVIFYWVCSATFKQQKDEKDKNTLLENIFRRRQPEAPGDWFISNCDYSLKSS